jgi:hypothetical protein
MPSASRDRDAIARHAGLLEETTDDHSRFFTCAISACSQKGVTDREFLLSPRTLRLVSI